MAETTFTAPRGDISSLLAGAAQTNADFDFGKINRSYWEGLDQAYKARTRDAFKDGLPKGADGSIDWNATLEKAAQTGGTGAIKEVTDLAALDLARQRLKYGAEASASDFPGAGGPAAQPSTLPPSTSRNGGAPVAPPIGQNARPAPVQQGSGAPMASAPQGDQPGSIVGMISAAGVPDELAGPLIAQVSAATRLDPNAAVNPQMAPRVQQIIGVAAQRMRQGNQAPAAAPPAPQPQAAANPAQDPTLNGLVPPGRTPQQQLDMLSRRVASGNLDAATAKLYQERIAAIQTAIQPTTEQKNAAASGMSTREFIDRNDKQTTDREVLTKSIVPKLDKSQETATAARDDIQAIQRATEQLNAPGGIVAGKFANQRLVMDKVGTFFGLNKSQVANTEAFTAAIGSRVLSLVKGLGAGTGISNADRDFAAQMAGGNITLDPKSIQRILDIGERAARAKIDQHNSLVTRTVKSNDALADYEPVYRVEAPAAVTTQPQQKQPAQRPAAPQAAFTEGQTATNKATGQRLVFRGGQWMPIQ